MAEERIPRPVEAIEFLSRKENLATDRWDELKWGEHSHAFTVAHSAEADVVDKIHGLLNKAMENGESFNTFKKGMLEMMGKEGWYGGNGHTKDDKAYINWRLRVIYDTNMKTAFAAGRYRQQIKHAEMRPIWVYKSKLVGKNRREEHIALHDKAFPYDDPFWDENLPPNGWGCECSWVTKSVSGAERDGVKVLHSDENGNLPQILKPDGTPVDWKNFTPSEWKYNPGKEALAPNFSKYEDIPEETLKTIMGNYNRSMKGTVLTKEEWKVIVSRTNEPDYKPVNVMYPIGNLSLSDYDLVRKKTGVFDSKVVATDHDLWHSTGNKYKRIQEAKDAQRPQDEIRRLINQVVDKKDFDTVYKTYSSPEHIHFEQIENKKKNEINDYLHFTKNMGNGKTLRIIFHVRKIRTRKHNTAMQLRTMEMVDSTDYTRGLYETIK